MKFKHTLTLTLLAGCLPILSPAETSAPIAASDYKTTVFADDFSAESLGKKWKKYKCSSEIRDGALVGIEEKDGGHAAVHSITVPDFSDVELNVDLKFEGSKLTNLTFNENGFKGSHAGHICRVVVYPDKVILRDGKTGVFKNKIQEMKLNGGLDEATKTLLKTKESTFPVTLEKEMWYSVTVRIKGDLMQVLIDGKLVGSFHSEGIAHATKNKIGLVTPKQEVHYDNFSIKVP